MTFRTRGALAALVLAAGILCRPIACQAKDAAGPALAPGEAVLQDGLTAIARHATGSGAVSLEIWIRCPADGLSASQPGIARLAAFAVASNKMGGVSLRDLAQTSGAQLSISVFQTATEFAFLVPSTNAADLQDALVRHVFQSSIDAAAFEAAKTRLAEQQAAAAQAADAVLRDGIFATMFASGPFHDSTFGSTLSLRSTSLEDVRAFVSRAYVPGNAIVAAIGNGDAASLSARLAAAAPAAREKPLVPKSPTAPVPAGAISIPPASSDVGGVALAWLGPPIADQRAATAMDFLSDYLADPRSGTLAALVKRLQPSAAFGGQFITLENPGVFFISVSGDGVDPTATATAIQSEVKGMLARPMSEEAFARAHEAYESRLLRQMDSPQGLADNYGWYFAEGAPAYAPSATDASLSGPYFANATALTPAYVFDVAKRYLGVPPVTVVLAPHGPAVHAAPGAR